MGVRVQELSGSKIGMGVNIFYLLSEEVGDARMDVGTSFGISGRLFRSGRDFNDIDGNDVADSLCPLVYKEGVCYLLAFEYGAGFCPVSWSGILIGIVDDERLVFNLRHLHLRNGIA